MLARQRPNTRRPSIDDPRVTESAAQGLLAAVLDWVRAGFADDPDEQAKITEEGTLKAIRNAIAYTSDGYEAARNLDIWEPDAALVAILDRAGHLRLEAHAALLRDWLPGSGLVAPEPGDSVSWARRRSLGPGTIDSITAEGLARIIFATDTYLLPWEDLIQPLPLPAPPVLLTHPAEPPRI